MSRNTREGQSIFGSPVSKGGGVQLLLAFLMVAFSALWTTHALAAPPAGAVIGNQATASYTDAGGTVRNSTSNLVETTILQVAGVDIEADQTKNGTPGQTVYFPHTVTNTGNGQDTYNLTVAQGPGAFNFGANPILIYADANGDGIPDDPNNPITTTPLMAAGDTYGIVVAAQVPPSATVGQQSQLTVTTTSQFNGAVTDSNTDTVVVSANAIVPVTKALSVQSGAPGTTTTVTLTYTNNGANTATNLTLTDVLDSRYSYVAGSGRWSTTNPTALTDIPDGAESGGVQYNFNAGNNTVTAVIPSVAPGQSGYLRFNVTVVATAPPGVIPNVADVSYDDGSGVTVTDQTNNSPFNVTANPDVRLSDINSTTDGDGPNDIVSIASAPQGSSVIFDNRLVNTGNGIDTFDITYSNSTFPAGTSFQLLRGDGTPMTDSNGNGVPDTGPVAAGAEVIVNLRAVLPTGATGGPFEVVKTATSMADPTQTDSVTDRLLTITNNTVDLTNNAAGPAAPGAGAGPEAAPVTTVPVNPGQTATFSLYVNNTTASTDSYNLAASTNPSFATVTMPAGWTVVFRNAATNAIITNTGPIQAGQSLQVLAQVTVPAGQAPIASPGQSIYFRALSPTSNAFDVKHDAVVVNAVTDVAVTPNNVGQGFPGGQVHYGHTLTNNGNTTVSSGPLTLADSNWSGASSVYIDSNNNGVYDVGEPAIDDISDIPGGLAPGQSVALVVRVFVPSGAADGATNTTTVTVSAPGDTVTSNNTATDTTTVLAGDVSLLKRQAKDANCDSVAEGAFTASQLTANPGECLIYQVTMTNQGTQSVSNSTISDTTPSFTTYVGGSASVTPAGTVTAPPGGSAGTVSADVGIVAPGSSATLTFGVQIEQ